MVTYAPHVPLGNIAIDEASVQEMLTDPDGPVGRLIFRLSEEGVAVAEAVVPFYPGTHRSTIWNPVTSTAVLPSGTTAESIRVHPPVRGTRGGIYGGGNVNLIPTIFLEPKYRRKSRQMHDRYPFMTTAVESLEGSL